MQWRHRHQPAMLPPQSPITTTHCMTAILDKHAPVKEQTVTIRPNTAWYTDDLRRAKQERKALERKRRKSSLEVDRQMYYAKRLQVNTMLWAAKHDHYSKMVEDNKHNSKALFKVIDKLLHRDQQSLYPRVTLPSSSPQTSVGSSPPALRQDASRGGGELQIHSQRLMTQDMLSAVPRTSGQQPRRMSISC